MGGAILYPSSLLLTLEPDREEEEDFSLQITKTCPDREKLQGATCHMKSVFPLFQPG
jgi:hypothetical protein